MNIFNILYTLIIGPLKLLFEVIYTLSYYVTQSAGLSVVLLSVAMNLLLLPLYNKADKIQEEENEIEKKLKPGVDHIKKSFKGDERYMILQTYYRQNNYKQTNVLKGSISLLLEVPFFIAAYDFLSNLLVLHNASFGPITNLSAPDKLLIIGNVSINVLPILMTLFNIVSSIIYTKGQPLRSKIQLFGMAALFLILLYNSPSALLLYWTLNNVFSLVKNIIMKCKNPGLIFYGILSVVGIVGIVYVFINPMPTPLTEYGLLGIFILMNVPLIVKITKIEIINHIKSERDDKKFFICTLLIALLTGFLIPSSLIASSPSEFIDLGLLTNPIVYVINAFILSTGLFVVWLNVYYLLLNENIKKIACLIIPIICVIMIIDYFFFGTNLGIISNRLVYENGLNISMVEILINIVVTVIAIGVFIILKITKKLLLIVILSFIVISSINSVKISDVYVSSTKKIENSRKEIPQLSLSKNDKNVIVIMLDTAISAYLPYIFEEKPELKKQFSGFTYYPNTLSHGWHTIFGAPALFGGYEYTPIEINKRSDESLVSKHNESLKVLPVLFSKNNYNVVVFDPPNAGYDEIPDISIFDGYENIKAYNTSYGLFKLDDSLMNQDVYLNRNIFCYSIMKASPLLFQNILYNHGGYNSVDCYNTIWNEEHTKQQVVKSSFINNYSVLCNLPIITNNESEKPSLFLITNCATHESTLLEEPDYIPKSNIDNTEYDEKHKERHSFTGEAINLDTLTKKERYHVNAASLIQLGKWFDYLKELGVYDNTRIIVVSDHGHYVCQFDDLIFNDLNDDYGYFDVMQYNPLLLYKDFNSKDFSISNDFMTNADVPTIVTQGVINNPVNPFTGKIIDNSKKDGYQIVTTSNKYLLPENTGNLFDLGCCVKVKDNIFDKNNWTKHDK